MDAFDIAGFVMDLYGDALSTSPEPRLREFYGELKGALWGGDLLVGQTWSTYTDLAVWPDILDFEGPGSAIAVRQPMVRWTKPLSDDVTLKIALEQPGDGGMLGGDMLTRWPDLVGTVSWNGTGGHFRAAAIIELIPLFGYYVGINHDWKHNLSSSLLYASQNVDNLALQSPDNGSESAYFSINLIWRPGQMLMFGAEFLRGGRRDISGQEGTDNRIQLSSKYSF